MTFDEYVEEQEKEFLRYHLEKCGTTRKAAKALGMTQSTIMRKKKEIWSVESHRQSVINESKVSAAIHRCQL